MMFVNAFNCESKRGGKVLFVADHHINERREFAIDGDRSLASSDRTPKRVAVVEIVRNQRPMFLRSLHRFARNSGRRFGKRTENSAGVKPARTFAAKDLFP